MTVRISLFNHKGGVSKTTTTLHLGWMLAQKGKRVLMVDADPQCNLTALVMGYKGRGEFDDFYKKNNVGNIRDGLAPAFESKPIPLAPVDCVQVPRREGLWLLPGHLGLAEYEVTLGIAQQLSESVLPLKNLPGAAAHLLSITANKLNVDYVLIDMNPSLSPINQNFLMTSDFFIIPCSPDFFSLLAINSLSSVLPRWHAWSENAKKLRVLADATYPYPNVTPKFLGTVIQKYRPRGGSPTVDFQSWIDQINSAVQKTLLPQLSSLGMALEIHRYKGAGVTEHCTLALISDFNTLIAKSQQHQTPVFALTDTQLARSGQVLKKTKENRKAFREAFKKFADRVISLTAPEP